MDQFLAISEIFYSIQGESSLVGLPTTFVRTFGCNLRCIYCDTKYSFESKKYELSISQVVDIVKQIKTPYVCITGGEPLLQKKLIIKLSNKLVKLKKMVSIETNGSIDISGFNKEIKIVMDVKTPSSFKNYYINKIFNFENLNHLKKNDEIKFVISNLKDYNFAKTFILKYNLLNNYKILFSPNLAIKDFTNKLSNWLLKDKLNVMFQPQLHKLIKEKPIVIIN